MSSIEHNHEICPLCNQQIPDNDKLVLDDKQQTASRFGRTVILDKMNYQMIKFILRQMKLGSHGTTRERMYIHIYGYDSDIQVNTVSVQMHKLRRAIRWLDVEIPKARLPIGGYVVVLHPRGWGKTQKSGPVRNLRLENDRLYRHNLKLQKVINQMTHATGAGQPH